MSFEPEKFFETAVREVREETGVWARIRDDLDMVSFIVGGQPITVQFYLMETVTEEEPAEPRAHEWVPFNTALERASHQETQTMLTLAEQKRTAA